MKIRLRTSPRLRRELEHAALVLRSAPAQARRAATALHTRLTAAPGQQAAGEADAAPRHRLAWIAGAVLVVAAALGLVLTTPAGPGDTTTTPAPALVGPAPVSAPAPAMPAPAPAPATSAARSHAVVAGDTLAEIAVSYAVPFEVIAADNNITDPNLIHVGQQLHIMPGPVGTEVIQPGSTPADYTQRLGLTREALAELNPHLHGFERFLTGSMIRTRT